MKNPIFKRKIYNEISEWKEHLSDKYALLIKGARRVGKSTIVEEFAKREFKSYIFIDFAHTSKARIINLKTKLIIFLYIWFHFFKESLQSSTC